MVDQVRSGDTVIVWKLDRRARSKRDLLYTMEMLNEAGTKFQSISEQWANKHDHPCRQDTLSTFARCGNQKFNEDPTGVSRRPFTTPCLRRADLRQPRKHCVGSR